MSWIVDRHWVSALEHILTVAPALQWVFTPDEFTGFAPNFLPLEFSELHAGPNVAFTCSKDDVDLLSAAILDQLEQNFRCIFANEVFVSFSNASLPPAPAEQRERHLPSLQARLAALHRGEPVRRSQINDRLSDAAGPGDPAVVIVNANGMGNVGDDLIAQAEADWCRALRPDLPVFVTGPATDLSMLARAQALVIGGGGILYDGPDGRRDLKNLANYFRYGFLAARRGVPLAVLGIGHQTLFSAEGRRYVAGALGSARAVTTRDRETAALLSEGGGARLPVDAASDVVFSCFDQTRFDAAPRRTGSGTIARIAVAGEIDKYGDGFVEPLAAALAAGQAEAFGLVLGNEDVGALARLRDRLAQDGRRLEVVDLRTLESGTIRQHFARADAVVTARYHGFILALCLGLPALVVDHFNGKKARLVREDLPQLAPGLAVHGVDDGAPFREKLGLLLRGGMPRAGSGDLQRLSRRALLHQAALARVLAPREGRTAVRGGRSAK